MRGHVLALVVAITFLSPIEAAHTEDIQENAPLGLRWGMSTDELRRDGVELTDFKSKEFGNSFIAVKLNRALADQDAALLSFGYNDKLWRIVINGRDYRNDPSGNSVMSRYNELSAILTEKYGKPKAVHRLGGSIYSEPRYFLAGIRGGESKWFSDFKTPELLVQIGVTASDSSTGSWRLIYEYRPLLKEFERSKRGSEKDKL